MGDLIDIGAGIIAILSAFAWWFIRDKERDRIDKLRKNSVGEKYMQLMAAFMKQDGARLTDMSPNHASMKIASDENTEETLSIYQSDADVTIYWSLSTSEGSLEREFKFTNKETQEEIIAVIAAGISKAKNGLN